MLWSSADLICLTLALKLLNRVESTLLVGYPLMIAASGLWFRVNMVWFTTGLAVACYLVLYFEYRVRLEPALPDLGEARRSAISQHLRGRPDAHRLRRRPPGQADTGPGAILREPPGRLSTTPVPFASCPDR